jgi:hypothetical protein
MSPRRITGNFFAAPLVVDDPRVARIVSDLEAALPGIRLDCEATPSGTARQLTDRDGFLRVAASRRELPFLFTCDQDRYVAVRGNEQPGILMPGGAPLYEVWLSLPIAEGPGRLEQALAGIGRASGAHWGAASPEAAAAIIATQTVWAHLPRPVPAGLPPLVPPGRLRNGLIPQRLGWINYWSEKTARHLGFPDPALDRDLLVRSRSLDNAWVVRLTDEPLDLCRHDHLLALREAYNRFAAIGRET